MKFFQTINAAMIALLCLTANINAQDKDSFEQVSLKSEDGLEITADLYKPHADKKAPFIVLCHQAGWSRGEYREIAPKLNKMGFNCVAIDQRSGKGVNSVNNETTKRAKAAKKGTDYADAEQDMVAALKWAKKNHAEGKMIIWGSSYSSALALKIAGDHSELVDGVLAFAPGEYFVRFGKPNDFVTSSAKKIKVPSFITAAKHEKESWAGIHKSIPGDKKVSFLPETKGNHGSRALWEKFADHKAYWAEVGKFLKQFN